MKEIHYFDRWPLLPGTEQEYVNCFPAQPRRDAVTSAARQLLGEPMGAAIQRTLAEGTAAMRAQESLITTATQITDTRPVPEYARLLHGTQQAQLLSDEGREATVQAAQWLRHDVAFVDASPEYLVTPTVPPRVQQIAPHARFVVVLRVRYAADAASMCCIAPVLSHVSQPPRLPPWPRC